MARKSPDVISSILLRWASSRSVHSRRLKTTLHLYVFQKSVAVVAVREWQYDWSTTDDYPTSHTDSRQWTGLAVKRWRRRSLYRLNQHLPYRMPLRLRQPFHPNHFFWIIRHRRHRSRLDWRPWPFSIPSARTEWNYFPHAFVSASKPSRMHLLYSHLLATLQISPSLPGSVKIVFGFFRNRLTDPEMYRGTPSAIKVVIINAESTFKYIQSVLGVSISSLLRQLPIVRVICWGRWDVRRLVAWFESLIVVFSRVSRHHLDIHAT